MAIYNDTSKSSTNGGATQFIAVKVGKIILDGSTDEAAEYGGYDAVGTIFYTRIVPTSKLERPNTAIDELEIDNRFDGIARPLFPYMKYYPLINEVVLILNTTSKDGVDGTTGTDKHFYLPNINLWNHPHHNNYPAIQNYTDKELNRNKDYQKAGILRRSTDATKDYDVHPLN